MSFTSINYTGEGKNLIYESVAVSYGTNLQKDKFFRSGNFIKDWYDRVKFLVTEDTDSYFHTMSSTINHFKMDNIDYDIAWLKTTLEISELIYTYDKSAIEVFVPKGTKPTWAELREMCGDPIHKK